MRGFYYEVSEEREGFEPTRPNVGHPELAKGPVLPRERRRSFRKLQLPRERLHPIETGLREWGEALIPEGGIRQFRKSL